jgi:hypothetical protein
MRIWSVSGTSCPALRGWPLLRREMASGLRLLVVVWACLSVFFFPARSLSKPGAPLPWRLASRKLRDARYND